MYNLPISICQITIVYIMYNISNSSGQNYNCINYYKFPGGPIEQFMYNCIFYLQMNHGVELQLCVLCTKQPWR